MSFCDAGIVSGRRDEFLNRACGSNQKTTQPRTQPRGCFKPDRSAFQRVARQVCCRTLPGRQTKILRCWLNRSWGFDRLRTRQRAGIVARARSDGDSRNRSFGFDRLWRHDKRTAANCLAIRGCGNLCGTGSAVTPRSGQSGGEDTGNDQTHQHLVENSRPSRSSEPFFSHHQSTLFKSERLKR